MLVTFLKIKPVRQILDIIENDDTDARKLALVKDLLEVIRLESDSQKLQHN